MATNLPANRRWYVVGLGSAIIGVAFAMSTACMPVLFSEIAARLDLDIVQIGVVWGFSSIAAIFSIPAAGFLADRFGAKQVLAIGCLLAGVLGALRGFSDSFISLTVTSLLFGLVSEALPVVVIKNTSLWFYGRGLGTAQGVSTACVGGGMLVGSMVSATVLSPWLGGWQNVLFFYGAISFAFGILWLMTAPVPARIERTGATQPPFVAYKHVLRQRNVWFIAIAMMAFAGSNKGVMGYLPIYLSNGGWSTSGAGGALAALNAAGMTAAVPFTLLSDRLGLRKSVLIPGVIITTISVGLLSLFTSSAVWPLAIMAGLFRDVVWAIAATMVVETEGIGPVYAGTAVGIIHAFTRIGYTFAPPVGNRLVYFRAGMPFVFWAGLSLAAMVMLCFIREARPRQIRTYL